MRGWRATAWVFLSAATGKSGPFDFVHNHNAIIKVIRGCIRIDTIDWSSVWNLTEINSIPVVLVVVFCVVFFFSMLFFLSVRTRQRSHFTSLPKSLHVTGSTKQQPDQCAASPQRAIKFQAQFYLMWLQVLSGFHPAGGAHFWGGHRFFFLIAFSRSMLNNGKHCPPWLLSVLINYVLSWRTCKRASLADILP